MHNKSHNLTVKEKEKLLRKTLDTKTLMLSVQNSFLKYLNKSDLAKVINDEEISFKNFLISCEFNGKEVCNENDFEFFQMNEFYKCFKFNSGKYFNKSTTEIRKTERFDKNHGFKLQMFTSQTENCNSPWGSAQGKFTLSIFVLLFSNIFKKLKFHKLFFNK